MLNNSMWLVVILGLIAGVESSAFAFHVQREHTTFSGRQRADVLQIHRCQTKRFVRRSLREGTDEYETCGSPVRQTQQTAALTRRSMLVGALGSATGIMTTTMQPPAAQARPESINRPDLLPKEPGLNVLQIEKFLTSGQASRMDRLLAALERDTGFRVRVLCQAYPYTPGLAIRDYWDLGKEGQKDDKYVVLVVDQFGGKGNVLNFNVGDGVKLVLPNGT